MAEFLPPSMHEPDGEPDAHPSAPSPVAPPPTDAPAAAAPAARGSAPSRPLNDGRRSGPGPLGRLISLIVSVGLAWALVVAISAWLLGLFLARG